MKNNTQKKLNILCILPHSIGGRLTASSIFDGFKQNNCEIKIYDEIYQPIENFKDLINNNDFDYIVGYDFSALKLKIDFNINIPVINYFSDVIESPAAGEGYKDYKKYLNRNDSFSFYWDKELYEIAKKEIKNIFYMPHFVNTELYKPTSQSPKYDIMFAGRLDTDYRLNLWVELLKSFPQLKFAWFAIEKHFTDAKNRLSEQDKELLTKTYKGFIDNEPQMSEEINNSKLVLNMHSQGVSSFNYRTFQTLSCGKILLSDYRIEAAELFKNNEVVFYKDIQDLKEKLLFYLNNNTLATEITKKARALALKNHDARNRVAEILRMVSK